MAAKTMVDEDEMSLLVMDEDEMSFLVTDQDKMSFLVMVKYTMSHLRGALTLILRRFWAVRRRCGRENNDGQT